MPEVGDFDDHTKLDYEKEVTGLYMSGHPYEAYQEKIADYTNCTIGGLQDWRGDEVKPCVGGIIAAMKMKTTKKGDAMCILQLEDAENSVEAVLFPSKWQEVKDVVAKGMACVVEGRKDDRGQILPDKIIPVDGLELRAQRYVKLRIDVSGHEKLNMKEFVRTLNRARGKAKVILELVNNEESMSICLNECRVDPEKLKDVMPVEFAGVFAA